jgi:hypothetical protein
MAKIGRYAYPEISFDESIAYAKVLQDKCGGEAKRDTYSEAIEKKGGRFNIITSALADWGLAKMGGGMVTITDLAKNIIFALSPDEGEKAKIESAKKVQLFVDISEKYPQGATLEQVRLFLRDRSGADIETVKKESSIIYKVYSSASNYLKPVAMGPSQPETKKEGTGATGVTKNMESVRCPQGVFAVITTSDNQTINITDADTYSELFSLIGKMFQRKVVKQEPQTQEGN